MSKKNEDSAIDRKMRGITMIQGNKGVDKVLISLTDVVEVAPGKGEDQSLTKTREYTAKSNHFPHIDFINSQKALLDHALAACELVVTQSAKEFFFVLGVDIAGDLFMNQSRVTFTLGHYVIRSEKIIKWKSPQITLSDDSKYLDWKDLQKKLKLNIEEAWLYLGGKHSGDDVKLAFDLQLPLFEAKSEKAVEPKPKKERRIQPQEPNVPGMMASPGVA